MDHAQKLVADIVARCKYQDVEISEPLAAFTARMMVQRHRRRLILEQEMSAEDQQFLVQECVHVLLQDREPWLETVKMQLEFDFTYAKLDDDVRIKYERKDNAIANLQRTIAGLVPARATDLDTLTQLYRQIFTLLMVDATDLPNDRSSGSHVPTPDREVEKEVAAALESVFPRVGLKSFVTMASDDKRYQLDELLHIVYGIRLFNRELGKGGVGINLSVDSMEDLLYDIARLVKREVQDANEICTQYTEVLLHVHHKSFGEGMDPTPSMIQRWQDELGNRRQFLSYLQSLEEDIAYASDKMTDLINTFRNDMTSLQGLVGGRTSLPKSQVYPLFEAVARSWKELCHEYDILQSRSRSFKALMLFKDSFDRTFSEDSDFLRIAQKSGSIPADQLFERVDTFAAEAKLSTPLGSDPFESNNAYMSSSFRLKGESKDDDDDNPFETDLEAEDSAGFPVRMPVDSTPEFMQLPLEYQGFCPWTIVERGGLLLPGDPSLGVVQYRNGYHVFVNERALGEFMIHPRRYYYGILKLAMKQPALIYLLRLQDQFPQMNLSALLRMCHRLHEGSSSSGAIHPLLMNTNTTKVDASTSTPTHFLEKYFDHNYEWNEWNIRRKALKIANLRHCQTVSCQTNLSHFRRDVDTQVYLPKDGKTQTMRDKSTTPARTISYLAGLRHGPLPAGMKDTNGPAESAPSDKHIDDENLRRQPAMISLTFQP